MGIQIDRIAKDIENIQALNSTPGRGIIRFGSIMIGRRAWTGKLGEADLARMKDRDGTGYLLAIGGVEPRKEEHRGE